MLHVDAPLVVALDDALSQREAQTPAALLGGEAGREHAVEVALLDALSGIGHVDVDAFVGLRYVQGDAALAIHGVDGILAEVLDDPLEERTAHAYHDGALGHNAADGHALG